MSSKQKVLEIYPTARAWQMSTLGIIKFRIEFVESKFGWICCGHGDSEDLAWENAWSQIQKIALAKFER